MFELELWKKELWKKTLEDGLKRLIEAQKAMRTLEIEDPEVSIVPIPRPRIFDIAPGVRWPKIDINGDVLWSYIVLDHIDSLVLEYYSDIVASRIFMACKYQPRLILRAIHRIHAAIAWCEARAEGRRRAVQELLRQQGRAVERLETLAAMNILAR